MTNIRFLQRQTVIPITGLLFVTAFSLSFFSTAHAEANVQSIGVSPATQIIDLAAKTTYTGNLTLVNNGTVDAHITVYARPYSVINEQYDSQFTKETANTDIFQWISFSKSTYVVSAGKQIDIPYSINVPSTASPGGHYAVIFAETNPQSTIKSTSILTKQRVGSLIYAHVAGHQIYSGSLVDMKVSGWQTNTPLTAEARVRNTGNIDFQSPVSLTVKDIFGNTKYHGESNNIILPGTTRQIVSSWAATPWYGLYSVEQTVSVLGRTSSSTHLVLIAPQWLVLSLIIIVVILTGYVLLKHKKRR